MDYVAINKKAYDESAKEFSRKLTSRRKSDEKIINKFCEYLWDSRRNSLLDIGPWNGQMSKLLSERGYRVSGIEFSEKMAIISRNTAPKAHIVVDDFLAHEYWDERFSGILAVAFIHLFPAQDAQRVLLKIFSILQPGGFVFISTTKHAKSEEWFFKKLNFSTKSIRFRKRFTKNELLALLADSGLTLVDYYENMDWEEKGKVWMNCILKKPENN